MKKVLVVTAIVMLFIELTKAQQISPYQPGVYYPGLVNLRDLAASPPGLILTDYNYWMRSNGYFDKDGEEIYP